MKKTLITLAALAAASAASAATVTDSYSLSDFSNGTLTLTNSLDFTQSFTISGSITIGNSDYNQFGTALIATTGDAYGWDAPSKGGFKLFLGGWNNSDGSNEDKVIAAFNDSGDGAVSKISNLVPTDTLTFSYSYNADTKGATLVFSDGTTSVTKEATLSTPNTITQMSTGIGKGEATTTDWALSMDVTRTVADTPGSGDAIPEPTTATLSLLALAGLAARRRRK